MSRKRLPWHNRLVQILSCSVAAWESQVTLEAASETHLPISGYLRLALRQALGPRLKEAQQADEPLPTRPQLEIDPADRKITCTMTYKEQEALAGLACKAGVTPKVYLMALLRGHFDKVLPKATSEKGNYPLQE